MKDSFTQVHAAVLLASRKRFRPYSYVCHHSTKCGPLWQQTFAASQTASHKPNAALRYWHIKPKILSLLLQVLRRAGSPTGACPVRPFIGVYVAIYAHVENPNHTHTRKHTYKKCQQSVQICQCFSAPCRLGSEKKGLVKYVSFNVECHQVVWN